MMVMRTDSYPAPFPHWVLIGTAHHDVPLEAIIRRAENTSDEDNRF